MSARAKVSKNVAVSETKGRYAENTRATTSFSRPGGSLPSGHTPPCMGYRCGFFVHPAAVILQHASFAGNPPFHRPVRGLIMTGLAFLANLRKVTASHAEDEDPQGHQEAISSDRQWKGEASPRRHEPFGHAEDTQAKAESPRQGGGENRGSQATSHRLERLQLLGARMTCHCWQASSTADTVGQANRAIPTTQAPGIVGSASSGAITGRAEQRFPSREGPCSRRTSKDSHENN